eukprot:2805175-Rhodomonas_salina.1
MPHHHDGGKLSAFVCVQEGLACMPAGSAYPGTRVPGYPGSAAATNLSLESACQLWAGVA